jgi:hypothetical protein
MKSKFYYIQKPTAAASASWIDFYDLQCKKSQNLTDIHFSDNPTSEQYRSHGAARL